MTKKPIYYLTSLTLLAIVGTILPASAFLYTGADVEEFNGFPDRIGKHQTNGPLIVGGGVINLADGDFANGMTNLNGDLLTGTVFISDLVIRDLAGVPIAGPFNADTPDVEFNEDLAYDGTSVWRAWFGGDNFGLISEHDPNNLAGPALQVLPQEFGPVGMTFINGQLWATDWAGQTVGTFDPNLNLYTPMFNTLTNAGCLAWDPNDQVLWVGTQGGQVFPYSLAGVQLGPSFQPLGAMPDTVDGCAFIEEGFEGNKTWTKTDYNWDPICIATEEILNPDGTISEICIEYRPANIINDQVLAESLDLDEDGTSDVQVQLKKNGDISNMNPGAIYALTTVNVTHDLDMLQVVENYSDCTDDELELLNQNKPSQNVKVAIADSDGDVTEVTDRLYDETDSGVEFIGDVTDASATVKINDGSLLTDGSTVFVLVKFDDQLKGDAYIGPFTCENTEEVTATIGINDSGSTFEATLRFTEAS